MHTLKQQTNEWMDYLNSAMMSQSATWIISFLCAAKSAIHF